MKPLKGKKIINLGLNLPGPCTAYELVQLGAHLTKIEPLSGDQLESFYSDWYQKLHKNQTIKKFDVKTDSGQKELYSVLSNADLLIVSMRAKTLTKLGLDWTFLHHKFPKLCMLSITGYSYPDDDVAGHDLTYQASLGTLRPPELPKLLLADASVVSRAVSMALILLWQQEKSGAGECQTISLVESLEPYTEPLKYGATKSDGALGGALPRYNLYQTKTKWIALAALEDHFWLRLQRDLNIENPDFTTLQNIFLQKPASEWEAWARNIDIPLVEVKTLT